VGRRETLAPNGCHKKLIVCRPKASGRPPCASWSQPLEQLLGTSCPQAEQGRHLPAGRNLVIVLLRAAHSSVAPTQAREGQQNGENGEKIQVAMNLAPNFLQLQLQAGRHSVAKVQMRHSGQPEQASSGPQFAFALVLVARRPSPPDGKNRFSCRRPSGRPKWVALRVWRTNWRPFWATQFVTRTQLAAGWLLINKSRRVAFLIEQAPSIERGSSAASAWGQRGSANP